MTESDEAPGADADLRSWLPAVTVENLGTDGVINAPIDGELPLGDIPPDSVVPIRLRGSGTVVLRVDSAGPRTRVKILGHSQAAVVVPADIRRLELEGPLPDSVLLSGSNTNVYVHSSGVLRLSKAEAVTANITSEVRIESDQSCTVIAQVELRHLASRGTVGVKPLVPASSVAPASAPFGRSTTIDISGDLTVDAVVDAAQVRVAGAFTAQGVAASTTVHAQRIDLVAPGRVPVRVGAGATLVAGGDVTVVGELLGTAEEPVTVRGGPGATVSLRQSATYCDVRSNGRQPLDEVVVAQTDHVTVSGTKVIAVQQPATAPDFEAHEAITAPRGCTGVRRLAAPSITVGTTCTGSGTITGDEIRLGPGEGDLDGSGPLHVEVGTTLLADGPAHLDISRRETGDGTDLARVGIAVRQLPSETPDDGPIEGVGVPAATSTTGSRIGIAGRFTVHTGGPCEIFELDIDGPFAAAGAVTLAPDALARAGRIRVSGDLDLGSGCLAAHDLCATALTNGRVHADEGRVVATSCEGLAVTCRSLSVTEQSTGLVARVTADAGLGPVAGKSDLRIGGDAQLAETDENVSVRLGDGDHEIPGSVSGPLQWVPASRSTLTVGGPITLLDVRTGEDGAELTLEASATVNELRLAGPLHVAVGSLPKPAREAPPIAEARLSPDADLALSLAGQSATTRIAVDMRFEGTQWMRPHASAPSLTVVDGELVAEIRSLSTGQLVIATERDGRIVLQGRVDDMLGIPRLDPTLLHLSRGMVTVDGYLFRVHAGEAGKVRSTEAWRDRPLLTVTPDGYIETLSGEFGIQSSEGRLVGGAGRRDFRVRRSRSEWDVPAVLLDSSRFEPAQEEPGGLTGTLVDVDVSSLRFSEYARLESLDVFSPLPGPLKALARGKAGDRALPHDTAQRLATIAALTKQRAVSGATRSATFWAAARAHHRAARPGERIARWFHRLVGYSQRPAVALATLAIVLVGLVGLIEWFEPAECPSGTGKGTVPHDNEHTLSDQLLRVASVPLAFFRVTSTAPSYEAIGCNPWWQVLATITVMLPLIFLVIAIRNYLRSPVD